VGLLRGEAEAGLVEILDPLLHWSVIEPWSEYSCVVFHFGTLLEVISVLHTAVSLGTMLQVGSGVPEVASFAWYSILQKATCVNCTVGLPFSAAKLLTTPIEFGIIRSRENSADEFTVAAENNNVSE
jgi:hypothetical protein